MTNFLLFNIIYYLFIIFISFYFIEICNKGYLGNRLQRIFIYKTHIDYIILMIITSSILVNLIETVSIFISPDFNVLLHMADNADANNNNNPQDAVRWWPTGVPQTWGVIGSAALAYRGVSGSPRAKALAALAAIGVSIPIIVFNQAVENPNGFHRLMYSWTIYKQTGNWPSSIPENINQEDLYRTIEANNSAAKASSSVSSSSYLPDWDLEFIGRPDNLVQPILDFFRPVSVEGYLDDLIGLEIFIHILLFIVAVSLFILFILLIITQLMLQNREFILKRFNNKFILYYIKYQILLAKISSILLPLLILLGLVELIVGTFYLLTHPVPYEKLPVDLHIFIKK